VRARLATEPGYPDRPNEDWAGVATTGVAVLLDGLSEAGGTGCVHGTPWYVHQLGGRLLTGAGDPARPLPDVLAAAIEEVRVAHGGHCDLTHPGSPGATVAVVREAAAGWDYLVLSDAVVVLDTGPEPVVVTDRRVEAHEPPPGGSLDRQIVALQGRRNRPGGYWVAQVDPAAAGYALTGTVPAAQAVLMSDGAALGVTDFGAFGWAELVRLVRDGGPGALLAVTRELEDRDPDRVVWPRYKTHDDATAVWVTAG
jgi:hypothetical protein